MNISELITEIVQMVIRALGTLGQIIGSQPITLESGVEMVVTFSGIVGFFYLGYCAKQLFRGSHY